jgi:hypothetical protein
MIKNALAMDPPRYRLISAQTRSAFVAIVAWRPPAKPPPRTTVFAIEYDAAGRRKGWCRSARFREVLS